MKKSIILFMLILLVGTVAFANGVPEATVQEPTGPVTVKFWLSNTGNVQKYLLASAEAFNAAQDKYIVEMTYVGSYTETVLKVLSSNKKDIPDIFTTDTETAYQIYAKPDLFIPVQNFVDSEKYDMSDIIDNLGSCYSDVNGNWLSLPLGNTATGFFYNDDVLKANGIDVRSLNSLEEVYEACLKLRAAGYQNPISTGFSSSFLTFPLTAQGIQYVNNNNGKDGIPTKSYFSSGECFEATKDYFGLLQSLSKQGLMIDLATSSSDNRGKFANQEIIFYFGFISSFTSVNNAVGGKFNFGFHESPTINKGKETYGQCVGGSCLFVGNNGNTATQKGAWEFMKFMLSEERTVGFAKASGYLPTTKSGAASAEYQAFITEQFPSAVYSIEAQSKTKSTCYNAWLPMFSDYHAITKEFMTKACHNPDLDTAKLTKEYAEAVDECLEYYLLENGII